MVLVGDLPGPFPGLAHTRLSILLHHPSHISSRCPPSASLLPTGLPCNPPSTFLKSQISANLPIPSVASYCFMLCPHPSSLALQVHHHPVPILPPSPAPHAPILWLLPPSSQMGQPVLQPLPGLCLWSPSFLSPQRTLICLSRLNLHKNQCL